MSMIKRYSQDAEAVELKAVEIARIEDPRASLVALAELFQECGRLAAEYPDPERVARMLVEDGAETWQAERWNVRHGVELVAA
ncbi:hypothetical protein [Kitasatospora sp. MBT66]|uniref:hypothetical protein n=1 Tax=Kitasatospora sp. MBT66 TaxID=1444769 RepID=UPI0005BB9DF9|nr:hypothetical protein [Kitasatospora sp. MBT66]